jgi:hypothetical protein
VPVPWCFFIMALAYNFKSGIAIPPVLLIYLSVNHIPYTTPHQQSSFAQIFSFIVYFLHLPPLQTKYAFDRLYFIHYGKYKSY